MNAPRRPRHVAVVGPTASGKSAVALAVARHRPDVEIVTVDSMQVYRGMDIGTAKPSPADQQEVRHHLLDLVEPSEEFTVAEWQRQARAALADIESRGRRALLVGGTGLYLRSVVDDLEIPGRYPEVRAVLEAEATTAGPEPLHARLAGLDPVAAARMEPANTRRVVRAMEVTLGSGRPFSSFGPGLAEHAPSLIAQVGVDLDLDTLDARIEARVAAQLADGFLEEVARLGVGPRPLGRTAAQALGYKELRAHLEGELELDAAVELVLRRTRRFARRQRAWFRRDPRVAWCGPDEIVERVLDLLGDGPAGDGAD